MSINKLVFFTALLSCLCYHSIAQGDSISLNIQQLPGKYISQVDKKIDKYSNRLTSKTEKTLTKLCRWENKVHALLLKASPETAERLFANKDMTFAGLLEKLQQGKSITTNTTAQYNEYRDKLSTSLKYIQQQKSLIDTTAAKTAASTSQKMTVLNDEVAQTEAVQQFIKQRKQQLVSESIKYIGKSKYLTKINKESYYYVETLKNYKELFSDSKKAEATARELLNKIPAFKKFARQNSMLAALFGPSGTTDPGQSLAGLQTRAGVNSSIQYRLSAAGPDAQELMKQQMNQAQAQLAGLKDKLMKNGGGNSLDDLPDFKPNSQRSRTLLQRLEYNFNLQFVKTNLLPSTADIGVGIGYKMNDKSSTGIGLSYKLGIGSIQHIRFSHQGIGLRSYIDWKIKHTLFISGGFELNHLQEFKKIRQLKDINSWQQSGLIGFKKKIPVKMKQVKNTQVQILYDFLYRTHIPVSQPVIFRIGYGF